MPGVLPMKVIKVGNSAQSRIAQACDRCRSKKIRCDGVRPSCSQCISVGFECRTSDKLSRRAFPRGYTESLEERVRVLEAEARELKDLLDEKDARLDLLSTTHPADAANVAAERPSTRPSPAAAAAGRASADRVPAVTGSQENTFRTQASQLLLGVESSDSYFMGSSSGRAFIASLKHKMQESGKPCIDFNPDAFLHIQGCPPLARPSVDQAFYVPPRLFSDRCVSVFFSEWAPLFPVLHRPEFLSEYEHFLTDAEKLRNDYKVARLYLVFSIAGLSSEAADLEQVARCERQWTRALDRLIIENTMDTLKCLVLAVLYCTLRADYRRLQHFKSVAVGLCYRLGLHQSQKRLTFDPLTLETRKKVFWTLYTLDCFTAAILGLPKILKEELVQAEYPSDADDECVTDRIFQGAAPGDFTQISSALALFGASRVLSRVLETNYPVWSSYDLSLGQMASLETELDGWYEGLPQHLRLDFTHDRPSADIACSRSPLLALAYYYIRVLIYRPAVGSSLGARAAPALVSISESSKRIIQITQLLEERNLSLSFCINKGDLLAVSGLTLLYQVVDLWRDSRLTHESTRLVADVLRVMRRDQSPGFEDLQRVANVLLNLEPGMIMAGADGTTSVYTGRRTSGPRTIPAGMKVAQRSSSTAPTHLSPAPTVPSQQHDASRCFDPSGQPVAAGEQAMLRSQGPLRRMSKAGTESPSLEARPRLTGQPLEGQKRKDSRQRLPTERSPCKARRSSGQTSAAQARQNLDYLEFHQAQQSRTNQYGCPHPHSPAPGASLPVPHPSASPHAPAALPGPLTRTTGPDGRFERGGEGGPQPQVAEISSPTLPRPAVPIKAEGISETEWEALLGAMEGGSNNVHNAIYGGTSMLGSGKTAPGSAAGEGGWPSGVWGLNYPGMGEMASNAGPGPSQSVLSMSEESLSSGEEVSPPELGVNLNSMDYQEQMQGFNLDDLFLL